MFFSQFGLMDLSGLGAFFFFCVLLVSVPCSVSIFYKLMMGVNVYSCYFPVFFSWVVYRISEQLYLIKFVLDVNVPRGGYGSLALV